MGRGHESTPPTVSSLFGLPVCQLTTRGRSRTRADRYWCCLCRSRGLRGGRGPPQSHLCVDADGADGRDLKIVTCEGRGGRGGPGTRGTGVPAPWGASAALTVSRAPFLWSRSL